MDNTIRIHSSDEEGEPPRIRRRREVLIEREPARGPAKTYPTIDVPKTSSKPHSIDKLEHIVSSIKQGLTNVENQLKSFTGELINLRNKLASAEIQHHANKEDLAPVSSPPPTPSTSKAFMKIVKIPSTPDVKKTTQQSENVVNDLQMNPKFVKTIQNTDDFTRVVIKHTCLQGDLYTLDMVIECIQKEFQKFTPRLKLAPSDLILDHKKYNDTVWVLKCSKEIKEALLNLEYLFSYGNRILIEDFFFTKPCTNCQRFGHTKMKCFQQEPVCRTCGEVGHSYIMCSSAEHICATCKIMGRIEDIKTHRTFSTNCPIRIYEERRWKSAVGNNKYYENDFDKKSEYS